jgi:hypothetical protein
MERFKWFDYVGALFLLFFVTKSALVPNKAPDSSNLTTNPLMSEKQVTDSDPFDSEQASEFRVERSNPSARPLLEEGMSTLNLMGEAAGELFDGTGLKNLYLAINQSFVMPLENIDALNPHLGLGVSLTSPSTTVPVFSW